MVYVHAVYVSKSVDDAHRDKHYIKTQDAVNVTGDAKVDPLYEDNDLTIARTDFDFLWCPEMDKPAEI